MGPHANSYKMLIQLNYNVKCNGYMVSIGAVNKIGYKHLEHIAMRSTSVLTASLCEIHIKHKAKKYFIKNRRSDCVSQTLYKREDLAI